MVVLSKRMQANADMCSYGGTVADIGCDHGYLSIYLVQSGKKDSAIAMDVRSGPLSSAKENISLAGLQDRIELRLSDGLEQLEVGEAGSVVIAGMGGPLMERILTSGFVVAKRCKELILQPQSEISDFRRFLMDIGFLVLDETCVFDEGKYYFPMKVCPADSTLAKDGYKWTKDIEFAYGGKTLQQNNETLKKFLLKEQAQWQKTLSHVETADTTEEIQSRLDEINEHLSLIEQALFYYR